MDHLDDDARVLRVHVDLAARQCRVDDLGGADVLLVRDLESLCFECLLVELAEDVLLAEVLRAEDDGWPSGLLCVRRACELGCQQADDNRHPERDGEGRLRRAACVFANQSDSFPEERVSVSLVFRRPLGVTAICNPISARNTAVDSPITHRDAARTPDNR
jgi:hypothetical protein